MVLFGFATLSLFVKLAIPLGREFFIAVFNTVQLTSTLLNSVSGYEDPQLSISSCSLLIQLVNVIAGRYYSDDFPSVVSRCIRTSLAGLYSDITTPTLHNT